MVCFFYVSKGFSLKQSLLTEHVKSSSCLEASKLQIFMSKQLCQSRGAAITVLQFICNWQIYLSENKDLTHEPNPAKN